MSIWKIINTVDLTRDDIPLAEADWHQISLFALSFDYKAEMQGASFWLDIRTFNDSSSLQELRAYLYQRQRWWNNRPGTIDEESIQEIRKAIELIRAKIETK